jgi:hypothetical protein
VNGVARLRERFVVPDDTLAAQLGDAVRWRLPTKFGESAS